MSNQKVLIERLFNTKSFSSRLCVLMFASLYLQILVDITTATLRQKISAKSQSIFLSVKCYLLALDMVETVDSVDTKNIKNKVSFKPKKANTDFFIG